MSKARRARDRPALTLGQADLVAGHLGLPARLAAELFDQAGRRQWLDDATETADAALVRAAERYDPDRGAFEKFAAAVIRDRLRGLLRRRVRQAAARPRTVSLRDDDEDAVEGSPQEPRDVLLADLLRRHLRRLSPGQRTAVRLRYLEGRSFAEVARRTGKSREAARRLCERGLAELRATLTAALTDAGVADVLPRVRDREG